MLGALLCYFGRHRWVRADMWLGGLYYLRRDICDRKYCIAERDIDDEEGFF